MIFQLKKNNNPNKTQTKPKNQPQTPQKPKIPVLLLDTGKNVKDQYKTILRTSIKLF